MKGLLYAVVVAVSVNAYSQEYKKFRIGTGGGISYFQTRGGLFFIEPSFRLNDKLCIGLRLEEAGINRKIVVDSYTLNGQYYFAKSNRAIDVLGVKSKIRSFVGLGMGVFRCLPGLTYAIGEPVTAFGFYPRIGLDYGHFTLSVDANVFLQTKTTFITYYVTTISRFSGNIDNYYLAIRGSVHFGGGKKKKIL